MPVKYKGMIHPHHYQHPNTHLCLIVSHISAWEEIPGEYTIVYLNSENKFFNVIETDEELHQLYEEANSE